MAIEVFRAFTIRDGRLVEDGPLPRRAGFQRGDVTVVLTSLPQRGDATGPAWEVCIEIGEGVSRRRHVLPLAPFLTSDEYRQSTTAPFSFSRLRAGLPAKSFEDDDLNWLWLYRDTLYVAERAPGPSELDEVVLRVKALHYQRDEGLKRLREQVANFEAIEGQLQNGVARKAIPDDVKLLVWSRDRGACVRCGATKGLHFDHVIPLSRGGSDEADNVQLLCRSCNLAKGDRLV